MSTFKQRLGNALTQQLNPPPLQLDASYSQRKSMNNSRVTGTVLNERVMRISEKISEIHSNIEKGKMGKIEEYEKKVGALETYFLEALDSADNNFAAID